MSKSRRVRWQIHGNELRASLAGGISAGFRDAHASVRYLGASRFYWRVERSTLPCADGICDFLEDAIAAATSNLLHPTAKRTKEMSP